MSDEGILFVEQPAGGFTPDQIKKFIKSGLKCWGVVPLKAPTPSGILLPGNEEPAVKHLVLVMEGNTVPVNLLAHQILEARKNRGGLNHLCQVFYGLSLQQLEESLEAAKARINEREPTK